MCGSRKKYKKKHERNGLPFCARAKKSHFDDDRLQVFIINEPKFLIMDVNRRIKMARPPPKSYNFNGKKKKKCSARILWKSFRGILPKERKFTSAN